MQIEKLGMGLAAVGLASMALCVVWWAVFYSEVIRQVGSRNDNLGNFFGCILVDSAPCSFIRAGARLIGHTPYEPLFFWLAAVVAIVGLLMNYSSRP
jgi:hypothetical protein